MELHTFRYVADPPHPGTFISASVLAAGGDACRIRVPGPAEAGLIPADLQATGPRLRDGNLVSLPGGGVARYAAGTLTPLLCADAVGPWRMHPVPGAVVAADRRAPSAAVLVRATRFPAGLRFRIEGTLPGYAAAAARRVGRDCGVA